MDTLCLDECPRFDQPDAEAINCMKRKNPGAIVGSFIFCAGQVPANREYQQIQDSKPKAQELSKKSPSSPAGEKKLKPDKYDNTGLSCTYLNIDSAVDASFVTPRCQSTCSGEIEKEKWEKIDIASNWEKRYTATVFRNPFPRLFPRGTHWQETDSLSPDSITHGGAEWLASLCGLFTQVIYTLNCPSTEWTMSPNI